MRLAVDPSALIAILLNEAPSNALIECLAQSTDPAISTAGYVEAHIVAEAKLGPRGSQNLDRIMREARIATIDVSAEDAQEAIEAWRRFGKGRHVAALNFGDCFSYALARRLSVPLLCVGEDFKNTDIETLPTHN